MSTHKAGREREPLQMSEITASSVLDVAPTKRWRRLIPPWIRSLVWIDSAVRYDAFLSYSWDSDREIAPIIQSLIQRFICPWYRPRNKRVFRDLSSLPAGSNLEAELCARLDQSAHLIVLACPAARRSRGMEMEARHWFRREREGHVLIIVTGSDQNTWNEIRNQLLPPTLRERLVKEPLWIPLQHRRKEMLSSPESQKLRGELTEDLKQVLLRFYPGRDWGQLRGQERAQRHRAIWLLAGGLLLFFLSCFAALYGVLEQRIAAQQKNSALARQLSAQAQVLISREPYLMGRAALLGAESLKRLPTAEANQVVRTAVGLLPRLVAEVPYDGPVLTSALSPAGEYAAISGEKGVDLYDLVQRRQVSHVSGQSLVFTTIISPDSKWLITGRQDGKVEVFGLPNGRQYREWQAPAQVTNLVITPDGEYVAARSRSPIVNIWSLRDARDAVSLVHGDVVQSIAFTEDGGQLCTGTRNGLVDVWNWSSRRLLRQMKSGGPVYGVTCRASGEVIAGDGTQEVKVWGSTPRENGILQNAFPIRMVTLSPDGQYLATAGENRADVWRTRGWRRIAQLEHQANIEAIIFHPGRPLVATASDDNTARIWDFEDATSASATSLPVPANEIARVMHQGPVLDVNFDGGGQRMVSASADHSAHIIEVPVGDPAPPWEAGKPTAADFSVSGAYIATGDLHGSVRVWKLRSRQLARTWTISDNQEIGTVRFSPDDRYLAVGARTGAISIVDLSSGKQVSHVDHGARVKSIGMDIRRRWTFTGGEDGKVKVWSADGVLFATLEQQDPVTGLALSSDGSRLAVTTGRFGNQPRGRLMLWDVGKRTVLRRVEHPATPLEAISFSEDSRMIAAGGQYDERPAYSSREAFSSEQATALVRLWDATSGQGLVQLAHDEPVWALAFSPDGRYLATGSNDGIARVWETATGSELADLRHPGAVRVVRFTRDGKHILTASFDPSGVLVRGREWDWQASDLIQQVCSRVDGGLRQNDWSRYVVFEPYDPICRTNSR